METNKLSEKEFGELFSIAYDGISEDSPPSEKDIPDFLDILALSLALTIDDEIGDKVNISNLSQQLRIIHTDEGPKITQNREKLSVALFQRLKILGILPLSQESTQDADEESSLKEIKDRFEAVHAALNGIEKEAGPSRFPERISIGGEKDVTVSFENAIKKILDKLGAHGIYLDYELLEAFVSELIGKGYDVNELITFMPPLIKNLKKGGIIKADWEGKPILTSIPPPPESQLRLTPDLFKTAHEKTYVAGSVTFIQDISAELAGLCSLDGSMIKEAIINVLFKLKDQHGTQKAQEIFKKEPERFYPLLAEELNK